MLHSPYKPWTGGPRCCPRLLLLARASGCAGRGGRAGTQHHRESCQAADGRLRWCWLLQAMGNGRQCVGGAGMQAQVQAEQVQVVQWERRAGGRFGALLAPPPCPLARPVAASVGALPGRPGRVLESRGGRRPRQHAGDCRWGFARRADLRPVVPVALCRSAPGEQGAHLGSPSLASSCCLQPRGVGSRRGERHPPGKADPTQAPSAAPGPARELRGLLRSRRAWAASWRRA